MQVDYDWRVLPIEIWVHTLNMLDSTTLLRVAAGCCREWRWALVWPLLMRRRDALSGFGVRLFSRGAMDSLHDASSLRWFCPAHVTLHAPFNPLSVLQTVMSAQRPGQTLKRLHLQSVTLDSHLVHAISGGLKELDELVVDNCSFAGTLPFVLSDAVWDLSASGIHTLRFRTSACQWNEWSIFRLIQRALGSTNSRLSTVEIIQSTWSRVRRMVGQLEGRRRLERLTVGVQVPTEGLVPLESMGDPMAQTEVVHLAARIECASPSSNLAHLLYASTATLRSLDLRQCTGLTDDAVAALVHWLANLRVPLTALALGNTASEFNMATTATALCVLGALDHLQLDTPRLVDEVQLAACPRIRTLNVTSPTRELLVQLDLSRRWTPVVLPDQWRRVELCD